MPLSVARRLRTWMKRRRVSRLLFVAVIIISLAAYFGGPHLSAWHHYRAAEKDLAQNHPQLAYEHLIKALRVWPDSAPTQLLAGQAARRAGDLAAARRHLVECQRLESKPSDASVLEWAMFQATCGELDRVETFLRGKLSAHVAESALIYEALIEGYMQVYRVLDALGALRDWLANEPDNPVARSLRGRAWQRVHAYPKAVEDFQRVIEIDAERDEDRYRLAECLIEVSNPQQAAEHLETLRRRGLTEPRVLVRLAYARNLTGQGDEGIKLLDMVLESEPHNATALAAHAMIDFQAGRLQSADRYARRAIDYNPYDRQAHFTLYQSLAQQEGRQEEAKVQQQRLKVLEDRLTRLIDVTNRLMPQRPRDAELHYELATLLGGLGQLELAANWYQSTLRLDPSHAKAVAALADYYEAIGEPSKAAEQRRKMITP